MYAMNRKVQSTMIPRRVPFGVLAYRTPGGALFCDDEGRILQLYIRDIDNREIRELYIQKVAEAAIDYGAPEGGEVVFIPGKKPVTDDTYDDMMEAMVEGEEIPGDWHNEDLDGSRY